MPYASPQADSKLTSAVTTSTLRKMKADGEKFITVALYDAPMSAMAQRCGVEVLLVGDSLGMTVLGYDSTIPVTMEQMIYHVEAVRRGNDKSLIMGDMPFMTYSTPELAMENATRIMQAGAHMVKIEGGEWLAPTVKMLGERGIPVCAHLGLTPQSVNKLGGFKVQGRNDDQAEAILKDAKLLDEAGADLLVLECVPSELAKRITEAVSMPVIGIGAGRDTDAQVLVINDILGLTEKPPKFSKNFLIEAGDIPSALNKYAADVKAQIFPADEHCFK
ncbi:3-methyl-2-oxobutanoate hydroxymethyltransferase [Pseudoteredinibacter isoporae]|uniref:3-methyl-2-oxobutanoate hydroxymethyltransferase n=1 Tax=Pseudoteredinibacter isoporae TaxID=570281 RepID=A0A7X0JWV4_9GAMM|nr:3-methyl-2-oxobutanoate hydroxymethyltransferase [Pseudoteredinibacter isoporae]MBB6522985.1 3-methyl-2-oxobutanoate hydroxymethyltransferase [Pseudoteredinibacter isoporae]NHO88509.1 3-methyl-2-oxobutanoate hydroxymethyltransferase [Pseudoteredinibacter isoporae]NIB22092.1 3-methyl-2-oxobutanoate hydroxymethyltransferase [Pseudoteredinibacter isoporae]